MKKDGTDIAPVDSKVNRLLRAPGSTGAGLRCGPPWPASIRTRTTTTPNPRPRRSTWKARVDFRDAPPARRGHARPSRRPPPGPWTSTPATSTSARWWTPRAAPALPPVPARAHPRQPAAGASCRPGTQQLTVRYRTVARGLRPAVADAGADRGRAAPVPLQPVPGHPRALGGAAAGHAAAAHPLQRGAHRARGAQGGDGRGLRRPRGAGRARRSSASRCRSRSRPTCCAFAVGDLASQGAGAALAGVGRAGGARGAPRDEFADVDDMLRAAEALFGPYDWERFDLLTMPPSFPYGGMENPRLTFLTPTLLAGDQLAGQRGRARAGALVDGQPRHQRERRALLAQRGLHRVRRAAHPRGARGRRRWPRCTRRSAAARWRRPSQHFRTAPAADPRCART